MSKFKRFSPDGSDLYPLSSRKNKVSVGDFGRVASSDSFREFLDCLPKTLAARDFRQLVDRVQGARQRGRGLVWGLGGHVVKVGLGPILIELASKGFVTAFATNGSGLIHDFEVAFCGGTSESVEEQLPSGAFGMARETGEFLNRAVLEGRRLEQGIGEAVGERLYQLDPPFADSSLLVQAYRMGIPVTVHVAIGTDIIHTHPSFSGGAFGESSQIDFEIFTQRVRDLDDGGAYLNLGSAVVLPEVFLKAVSLIRSSGHSLEGMTTANLDFLRQYRPLQNVVVRPVADSGWGVNLIGHHEIMIPLLASALLSS